MLPNEPFLAKIRSRRDRPPKLGLIATDAYAFNVLSRGQLEYFRNLGIEMDLYCNGTKAQMSELQARYVGEVIKIRFRRKPNLFWDWIALLELIWKFSWRRYDAVVFSTPKAMFLGALASAATFQRRRICFVRGRAYELKKGGVRRLFLAMDRLSFALSHQIIFLSKSLQDAYEADQALPEKNVRVLGHGSSNGVDLKKYRPIHHDQRENIRLTLGLSPHAFLVIIPGRIVPDKGISEALLIADRLRDRPDINWLFIGWPESDKLLGDIQSRSERGVFHLDHSPGLHNWLGAADLAFLPSYREGFGNVAIEAAACGLPTLAFDVVGLKDSVAENISGHLVPFGDLAGCEEFIRSAADDREKLRSRYSGAREWVADRFEQRTVWHRYAEAFLRH